VTAELLTTSVVRLIAFPYAGGSAFCYRELSVAMPEGIELITHELPGHGARMREALQRRLPALVEDAIEQLRARLKPPYAFYGHSFGAWLACDVAHRLVARGLCPPAYLFVSARRAPTTDAPHANRHALPREMFFKILTSMGGVPPSLAEDPELVQIFEPVLRADFEALETRDSSPRQPLDVPIHVILGRQDDVTRSQAERWQDETLRPLTIQEFDGAHFFIRDHAAAIARTFHDRLRDLLATTDASSSLRAQAEASTTPGIPFRVVARQ
jgi:surfactin synthase thioesterase subunit